MQVLNHREASRTSSENPSRTYMTLLLLFQKKLEIYSVELSGTKDITQTDQEDDKEKYKDLKNDHVKLKKSHQKEELKKELDLVSSSSLKTKGSCCPPPESILYPSS